MVDKGRWRILTCVVTVLLIAAICTAVSVNNYVSGLNRVVVSSSVSKEFSSKKVSVSFDAATNRYLLRAEVSLEGSFIPLHGEPVQISMGCVTAQYDSVVPKRAIYTDKDGYTFVYLVRERDTVLGKENYLDKVGVTIVDSYQYDVAVLARLENFVVNCSREPADLEAVLILQGNSN